MSRRQTILNMMLELQAELEKIKAFGEDTYDDGTILRFGMQFEKGDPVYQYAAIKAIGQWWVTGVRGRQVFGNWDLLVQWWGNKVVTLEVMDVKFSILPNATEAQQKLSVNTESHSGVDYPTYHQDGQINNLFGFQNDPDGYLFTD